MARWLQARQKQLGVQYLVFDNKNWNVQRNDEGWSVYNASGAGDASSLHYTHVHVTVYGNAAQPNGPADVSAGTRHTPVGQPSSVGCGFHCYRGHTGQGYPAPRHPGLRRQQRHRHPVGVDHHHRHLHHPPDVRRYEAQLRQPARHSASRAATKSPPGTRTSLIAGPRRGDGQVWTGGRHGRVPRQRAAGRAWRLAPALRDPPQRKPHQPAPIPPQHPSESPPSPTNVVAMSVAYVHPDS